MRELCSLLFLSMPVPLFLVKKKTEIEFLGHIIPNEKIRPSEHKIDVVKKFPEPICLRQL